MKKLCKVVLVVGLCVGLGACSSEKAKFNETIVAEYGDKEVDKTKLLTDDEINKDVEIQEIQGFDNKKLGIQELVVNYTKDGKETVETETVKIEIKDTKKPVIKFVNETVTLEQGTSFEVKDNIESVTDLIDGDIAYNENVELKTDAYHYESDVDVDTIGDYKVKLIAYDKNGNESTTEFTVSVIEKQEEMIYNEDGTYTENPNYTPVTNYTGGTTNNNTSGNDSSYTPPVEQPSNENTYIPPVEEPTYTPPVVEEPTQPKLCPGGRYDEYMPCSYIPANLMAGVSPDMLFTTWQGAYDYANGRNHVITFLDRTTNGWEDRYMLTLH